MLLTEAYIQRGHTQAVLFSKCKSGSALFRSALSLSVSKEKWKAHCTECQRHPGREALQIKAQIVQSSICVCFYSIIALAQMTFRKHGDVQLFFRQKKIINLIKKLGELGHLM